MKRYFFSFVSYKNGLLEVSNRQIKLKNNFNWEQISKDIEKEERRTSVTILFFKELKKYEKCNND
jgi:hypothetical protein